MVAAPCFLDSLKEFDDGFCLPADTDSNNCAVIRDHYSVHTHHSLICDGNDVQTDTHKTESHFISGQAGASTAVDIDSFGS